MKLRNTLVGGAVLLTMLGGSSAFAATTASKPVDLSCPKAAYTTRENAITTAWSAEWDADKAALQARSTAVADAFSSNDKPTVRKAIAQARKNFSAAVTTARKASVTARKAAWVQFAKDMKACKVSTQDLESANANSDDVK